MTFYEAMDWLDKCVWIERIPMMAIGLGFFLLLIAFGRWFAERQHRFDQEVILDVLDDPEWTDETKVDSLKRLLKKEGR